MHGVLRFDDCLQDLISMTVNLPFAIRSLIRLLLPVIVDPAIGVGGRFVIRRRLQSKRFYLRHLLVKRLSAVWFQFLVPVLSDANLFRDALGGGLAYFSFSMYVVVVGSILTDSV